MKEMRWTAPAEGGLFELGRRVTGRGEYRGLSFHEIEAKTILNRVPGNGLPFDWTINTYRGCSHACAYCFARPTHEYLGFDIGKDFDSEIVVKVNAVELTRAETAPGRWAGEPIAMGTNTDPYQPAEGKYRLTRGVLEVLGRSGQSVLDPDQVHPRSPRPRLCSWRRHAAPTSRSASRSAPSTRRCGA
jgi:hypothetical protein